MYLQYSGRLALKSGPGHSQSQPLLAPRVRMFHIFCVAWMMRRNTLKMISELWLTSKYYWILFSTEFDMFNYFFLSEKYWKTILTLQVIWFVLKRLISAAVTWSRSERFHFFSVMLLSNHTLNIIEFYINR